MGTSRLQGERREGWAWTLPLPLPLTFPSLLSPRRDRSCTLINVEGDAFGAGLLQHYVNQTECQSSEPELIQVKSETPLAALPVPTEEGNPLLKRYPGPAGNADICEKESVM